MKHFYYIISIAAALLLAGCSEDEKEAMDLKITSFEFKASLNKSLSEDVVGTIKNDEITVYLEGINDVGSLIPTFSGVYDKVFCNGKIQYSDKSAIDFNGQTVFNLHDGTGTIKDYKILVYASNYIPKISIRTSVPIDSKNDYVSGTIKISNCPEASVIEAPVQVRGRGNATWYSYPKKSYKFKFEEAMSVLGFPEDKDWVLLAEYCDKSLLRTTYMNCLARAAGVDWVPKSTHVDLYLNGAYNGTYLLIEQVEKGKSRVKLADDGFLIEDDNYYAQEPLYFKTDSYKLHYTFKYPDPDKGSIVKDDASFAYINSYMNDFEAALLSTDYRDEKTGYRKYIDPVSFAKWYLVMEILDTQDPNFYYTLFSRSGSKLKMTPLWDAEWTLGLASAGPNGWLTYPSEPIYTYDKEYWRPQKYFGRLFKDPYFVEIVYRQWQNLKPNLSAVKNSVAIEAESIKLSQVKNFERWDILGKYYSVILVTFDTWEEEVAYASDWFDKRVEWFDSCITNLHNTVK